MKYGSNYQTDPVVLSGNSHAVLSWAKHYLDDVSLVVLMAFLLVTIQYQAQYTPIRVT